MILYHDSPSSQGEENVIRRAKQLSGLRFTPIRPLPLAEMILSADGKKSFVEKYSPACLPLQGVPYSSVRRTETYVGFNISPETFLSALSNPNSAVYTRPISGTGQNVHNYYGTVCSCFASYCLDLPYRTNCARWPSVPGLHPVDTEKLENLRLADVILNPKSHIALVTDIERDVTGRVHYISVTESTLPLIRTKRFSPEEFRGYWLERGYRVYRYDGVKDVSYTPDPFAPAEGDPPMPAPCINRSLMTDFGNRANYRLGEQPVELSVFEEGCKAVEVTDPDGEKKIFPVENGFVRLEPEKTGIHTAACVREEGRSDFVSWCVTGLRIRAEKEVYTLGEKVNIQIGNPAGDPLIAWQYNRRDNDKGVSGGWLDGQAEDALSLPGPQESGPLELYLIAKNAYGCYTSRRIPLEIAE